MLETTMITTFEGVTYEILMRGRDGHSMYHLLKAKGFDEYIVVYGLCTDNRDSTKYCWSNGYYFNEHLLSAVNMMSEKCEQIIHK